MEEQVVCPTCQQNPCVCNQENVCEECGQNPCVCE